jgi:hypothetical protein
MRTSSSTPVNGSSRDAEMPIRTGTSSSTGDAVPSNVSLLFAIGRPPSR